VRSWLALLRRAFRVHGRDGHQHLAFSPLRMGAQRAASALSSSAQLGANVTLCSSMGLTGMRPSLAVEGSTNREVFGAYVDRVLAPSPSPGQAVVMNNSARTRMLGLQSSMRSGAASPCTFHPTLPISARSRKPSRRSRDIAPGGSSRPRTPHRSDGRGTLSGQ
jgi:hypothetical protein